MRARIVVVFTRTARKMPLGWSFRRADASPKRHNYIRSYDLQSYSFLTVGHSRYELRRVTQNVFENRLGIIAHGERWRSYVTLSSYGCERIYDLQKALRTIKLSMVRSWSINSAHRVVDSFFHVWCDCCLRFKKGPWENIANTQDIQSFSTNPPSLIWEFIEILL